MTLNRLRTHARLATLFAPTTLAGALEKPGFVQADPIRARARAQDLILRHRVRGYRAGDLGRSFARLKLEEDFLFAYGFMSGHTTQLLHPRPDPECEAGVQHLVMRVARILAPRDLVVTSMPKVSI